MFAGHQGAAGRSADRRPGKGLGEADPLGSHAVDIRGLEVFIAHVRELKIGQLVGHDVDDVGLVGGPEDAAEAERREQEEDLIHGCFRRFWGFIPERENPVCRLARANGTQFQGWFCGGKPAGAPL